MNRFAALAIALVCVSAEATAGVEFGGTMGLHIFNEENAVGEPDVAGDQRVSLSNSALFGLRLGVYFGPMFGIEVEGGYIPGETRDGENNVRRSSRDGHHVPRASGRAVPRIEPGREDSPVRPRGRGHVPDHR